LGTKTSDRVREQLFRSTCSSSGATMGIQAVHRARHLFPEHCRATPDPIARVRMAGGHVFDESVSHLADPSPQAHSKRVTALAVMMPGEAWFHAKTPSGEKTARLVSGLSLLDAWSFETSFTHSTTSEGIGPTSAAAKALNGGKAE